MSKKMLINASHPEENRVAIVVDGVLSELDIELAGQEQARGNIYKAAVVRVETGLQAAFVDYGAEKLGFLQISEIHPGLYPARGETNGRPRIADILHRGMEIMVQVVKEERGNKGAALTTFLSLPGRYMVLMPDSTTKGVSRKIAEEGQRKALKKTMAELNLPEQMGYIVRTAGIGKEKEELKRDFDYLVRLYEGIVERKEQVKAPAQLYQESNLAIRSIRDYFTTDMDEVLVDNEKVYQDTKDFFALVMPEHVRLVKRHRERRPIFSRYQIEEQIDTLSRNQVSLSSGGSIVIDPTEALVAIDVNSGKMSSEKGIEATAVKTNLEAAAEIGRQLRLRDLGGLIVIDFIDMRDRKNNREVEQELRKALKNDKARVSIGRISQFGLMEMSRQRIKPVLSVGAYCECPHCHGLGKVKSIESQAVSFLRQVHTAAAKGQIGHLETHVPHEVANFLLNQKRTTINRLETLLGLKITIIGRSDMLPGDIELESFKREKDTTDSAEIVPVSHANQIEQALAEVRTDQDSSETESETENTKTTSANSDAAETPEEAAPAKKRRRRRRKKPAPTSDSTAAEESQPEPDSQQVKTADAKSETALGGDNDQPAEPEQQDAAATKPKRRPRRPRKKPATAEDKSADTPQEATLSSSADAPVTAEQQVPAATAGVTTETAEATPPAVAKKQPQSARRTRAKKPVEAEPSTVPEDAAAQKTPPADAPPSEDAAPVEPPAKRTRRPRKPAATAETPANAESGREKAAETTDTPAPKRPRRSRKTTATETAVSSDNEKTVSGKETTGDDASTAPATKTQRRRRSTTAKKTETTAAPES
ncbi:MAG: Rne/Rng family ribonuclease [Pelovirga sp.]